MLERVELAKVAMIPALPPTLDDGGRLLRLGARLSRRGRLPAHGGSRNRALLHGKLLAWNRRALWLLRQ